MTTAARRTIIALNGLPIGSLEAKARAYCVRYFPEYQKFPLALPLSLNYPLHRGPWNYSFARELPPYFQQLLPEGWLLDVAENAHLPMDTPLDQLATLCRENLGAAEIYQLDLPANASYEAICEQIAILNAREDPPALFQPNEDADNSPKWTHCLRCHETLPNPGYNSNYHDDCALDFFGGSKTPYLAIDSEALTKIATDQLRRHESLTGVQPKFSAIFRDQRNGLKDLRYIIKPEPSFAGPRNGVGYQHSSIAELAAMHFAELLELEVAETALLYLNGEQPALVSKRFDRKEWRKIHSEDFAQALSTRDKYRGSHEKVANLLKKISDPGSRKHNLKRFFKVIVFNFLIGNTDGHLKNFSIFHKNDEGIPSYSLTPFYDLMPATLFASFNDDQLALTVEGKKNKLKKCHFVSLAIKFGISIHELSIFIDEFEKNLDFYYDAFGLFGVPADFLTQHKVYIEKQLGILKMT